MDRWHEATRLVSEEAHTTKQEQTEAIPVGFSEVGASYLAYLPAAIAKQTMKRWLAFFN